MTAFASSWPRWALGIGSTGLMVLYLILHFLAELPRQGTLEWICMYHKPAFSPPDGQRSAGIREWLWSLLTAVLAGSTYCVFHLLAMGSGSAVPHRFDALLALAQAAVTGFCAFFFLWQLTGSRPAALAGAALLFSGLFHDPAMAILLLLALFCLYRWTLRKSAGGVLWLVTASLPLSAALFFYPAAAVLIVPWAILLVGDGIWRCRNADASGWSILLNLAVCLVSALAFRALFLMAYAVLRMGASPAVYLFGGFLLRDLFFLPEALTPRLPALSQLISAVLTQLPMFLFAVGGAAALVTAAVRRHDAAAAFAAVWNISLLLLALLWDVPVISVSAAISCAYITNRLTVRGCGRTAALGAVLAVIAAGAYSVLLLF